MIKTKSRKFEIRIEGVINTDLTEDDLYAVFIDFIEKQNSFFGGMIEDITVQNDGKEVRKQKAK